MVRPHTVMPFSHLCRIYLSVGSHSRMSVFRVLCQCCAMCVGENRARRGEKLLDKRTKLCL